MNIETIEEFAKNKGYIGIKRIDDWNGYECYSPIYSESEESFIGLPLKILVLGDEIRMTTGEEAMQRMRDMREKRKKN